MRVRSNVVPTPIVSAPSYLPEVISLPPEEAPALPHSKPETPPLVIDLGSKNIELQPGEFAKLVDKMNETAEIFNSALRFVVTDDHVSVKIVDRTTGEVLREIPPERLVDVFNRMEDALGLLLDVKI